jgi:hypothetical protein
MLTRLLLGMALAVAFATAVTATPASADTCGQTKPPLDAASKQISRADMLWVSHTGSVGITTPAGTGAVQVDNAGPMPLQALLIDAEQNALRQLIVSNGRGAHLYLVNGCNITTVIDQQGAPFLFDLQNLRGNGTGVACMDLGAGPHLVGLQATLGPTGWTVRRTEIDFAGATATPGRSDTVAATSAQDPAVTEAQTISCGDLTITHDGVQQP